MKERQILIKLWNEFCSEVERNPADISELSEEDRMKRIAAANKFIQYAEKCPKLTRKLFRKLDKE